MTYQLELVLALLLLLIGPILIGLKTGHLRWVAPLAVCVTAAALLWGWTSIGEDAHWTQATLVGDRTVEITYVGGECEDHRSVSVDESDAAVTVKIRTWSFASSCSDIGVLRTFKIKLREDLGSRELIDGSCTHSREACTRKLSPAS